MPSVRLAAVMLSAAALAVPSAAEAASGGGQTVSLPPQTQVAYADADPAAELQRLQQLMQMISEMLRQMQATAQNTIRNVS